jgi:hypothetical protein
MKRSIWKWSWITLWLVGSIVAMNAVLLNPMTLKLTVLDRMRVEPSPKTSPQSLKPDLVVYYASPRNSTGSFTSTDETTLSPVSFYTPGEFVELLPESPEIVSIPGVIKGTVKLSNPHAHFWRVTIEGTIVLANGTRQQVLHRTVWMTPKQTVQRPVQLRVDSQHFLPGPTQFQAVLKDDQGQIIDQASVTFTLTVDFP